MRRTSANKLAAPPDTPWAEIACSACPAVGITIMAMGVNDNGAWGRAFCGTGCATLAGWPWLKSERDRAVVQGQAELFAVMV